MNTCNGYSLFNDVEDGKLRGYNRGVVMANILLDNSHGSKVSNKGALLFFNYAKSLPKEELGAVLPSLKAKMSEHLGVLHQVLTTGGK